MQAKADAAKSKISDPAFAAEGEDVFGEARPTAGAGLEFQDRDCIENGRKN
jgi:hypothetical protein